MIQHLQACKPIIADKCSGGWPHLSKSVNWEQDGKKMVFKYQFRFLTVEKYCKEISEICVSSIKKTLIETWELFSSLRKGGGDGKIERNQLPFPEWSS